MRIFDRAVKALNDVDEYIDYLADNTSYVTALEAAGLLAPDLPEANEELFAADGKGWSMGDTIVWTAPKSMVMIQNIEPGNLAPASARKLAYTLLAAADYAEKEQGNE